MDFCAGVDGCRGGWVVATRDGIAVIDSLATLLHTVEFIGIDMPIGLPDGPRRASDAAARAFLGPRRSSVFPTPSRSVIDSPSHAAANERSRSLHGIGISAQSFNLFAKIREVDALLQTLTPPERARRIAEVHPECSFREMTGEVLPSKKTPAGAAARRRAIEDVFGVRPSDAPRGAAIDDVLDAYAALWSTERFASETHRTLPEGAAERDATGTPMRLVI